MTQTNSSAPTRGSMVALLYSHWTAMAVSIFLLGVATVLALLQPILAGGVVDQVSHGKSMAAQLALLAVMLVAQLLLDSVGHFRLEQTGEKIVLQLRAVFTDHVVRLPIGLLDRYRTGDLLARVTSDASVLREMPRCVADIIFGVLTFAGAVILMSTIEAVIVPIVLALVAVAFAASSPVLSRIQRSGKQRQQALGDYAAGLDRALGAARTVKLFGAEHREVDSISISAHSAYRAGVRIALFTAVGGPIARLGITGSFLAILVVGGRSVANGELAVGQFVTLFAYALYAVLPVTNLTHSLYGLRTSAGAYERLAATLRELPEDNPGPQHVETLAPSARQSHGGAPLAEFEHVSFAYGKDPVLSDVSFSLKHNQVTALIGQSGAGKSTVLALLCRFHDPLSGTVRWEGYDYRSIPLKDLRSRLSLLEQDAPVLHGTIRDNLLIANPNAQDTDLWLVLKQANIADEIAALPDQLDTAVLERGRSLSGGQRQRLALARAFLSQSQLILMDEPTAHLDRANEYDVMGNLMQARGSRSLLVVAHRLSTVTNADQILILERGRIHATGTHTELLRHSSTYQRLVEHELADK